MMKTLEDFQQSPIITLTQSIIIVKDLSHRFVAASYGYAHYVDLPLDTLLGLSDNDMPWQSLATDFIEHDIDVLCGDHDKAIHIHSFTESHNHSHTFLLSEKKPLFDAKGLIAGTYTHLLPLTASDLKLIHAQQSLQRVENLSKKEYLILSMLVMGHKRSAILKKCKMTGSTYGFHMRNLKTKFHVNTTHELIIYAIKRDVFPLPIEIYP